KRNDAAKVYMRDVVVQSLLALTVKSNDLIEKHGCVLAVSEILLALHSIDPVNYVTSAIKLQVCTAVNTLTAPANAQLLNGRGGQIMREAICHLIGTIAETGLLYNSPQT